MRNKKKVSVIVPVYNVEKYLDKCIKSIINQSYKDIEIILVDDGSTDSSPKICDDYAKNDKRIKVIHKENGGLSSARNAGIEIASGDLLSFIDSDDSIEPDLYEKVFSYYNDNDIVVFGIERDYPNGKIIKTGFDKVEEIDNITALIYLNNNDAVDLSSCNKIFNKKLFDNVRFPINKKCEDYYIMYRIFDAAQSVLLIPFIGYHYFQREGSISRSVVNLDYIYASQSQIDYFTEKHSDYLYIARSNFAIANMNLYVFIVRNRLKESKIKKQLLSNSRKYIKDVVKNHYLKRTRKIKLLSFVFCPHLYSILVKLKNMRG